MANETVNRQATPATLEAFLAQYEVAKHVTLPVVQIPKDGSPIFVKITSKIEPAPEDDQNTDTARRRRKVLKGADGKPILDAAGAVQYEPAPARKMDPPNLCEVVNMRDGEVGVMVVNATIQSNLESKYPKDGYVGKLFQINHLADKKSASGYNYRTFNILELVPKAKK